MSQTLFQVTPLSQRSFFQKIFQQRPQENAVIELNNLLASKPVRQISISEISEIESRYSLSLVKEFRLNLEEFYAVYLNHCFQDRSLSSEELDELKHLKHLLSLDDKVIESLHAKIGAIIYQKSFEEAIMDGRLTADEKAFLNQLESELKIPNQLANKISQDVRTALVQNYVTNIITDQRISTEEEKELQAIAANLNVTLQLDAQTKGLLEKLKIYWALENLDIPTIQVDIALQKTEKCFLQIPNVAWYELRSVRQRTSSSGYSTSFRVAKGFYLRSSSYKPRSYSVDQMTLIDQGTLYLSNKRILFTGQKKNSNIQLGKILNIAPYSTGVEIDKESGKSPLLQFSDRADVFCIILERLLREGSQ